MSNSCADQSGYIAVIGCPNAGKSTLINSFMGKKIAGVSRRPQTTRSKISGVLTEGKCQFIYLDTPGMHPGRTNLNLWMVGQSWSAVDDADIVLYCVESVKGWRTYDSDLLMEVKDRIGSKPVFLLILQAERVTQKEGEAILGQCAAQAVKILPEVQVRMLSAKRRGDVVAFHEELGQLLPEHPHYFDDDTLSDRSTDFVLGEHIQEQLFRNLGQEVPHRTFCKVSNVTPKGKAIYVVAQILTAHTRHEPIIIGRNGQTLKKIGQAAREQMEKFLGEKVYLDLTVGSCESWPQEFMNNFHS